MMEERLTLWDGSACGSLRYSVNCTTSQALPKAFQDKRKVDVIKAIKQRGKRESQKLIFLNRGNETDTQIFLLF